jgi:hypothetical protein
MNRWLKAIAILEMIGGVVGILYCPYMIFTSQFVLSTLVIIALFFVIYLTSLLAGIYLWKGTKFGRTASIVVQIIQLPKFISPALIFMFSFGFDLFVHLTVSSGFSKVGVEFRFLADSQLFFANEGAPILIGISIPAAIALVKLHSYDPEKPVREGQIQQGPPSPDKYLDLG